MTEKHIFFQSGTLRLEGLLERMPGEQAMIMAHPHPLYGGNMHNPVVAAVLSAYLRKGYSTLRFNFRGVGQSEGQYSEGIGEQEDVRSALTFLAEQGLTRFDLGGYSFGAWVCASGLKSWTRVQRFGMVSPPVAVMSFDFFPFDKRVAWIIGAEGDDIAPPAMIREQIPLWNPDVIFKVIKGSDHFYGGQTQEIETLVGAFLEKSDYDSSNASRPEK